MDLIINNKQALVAMLTFREARRLARNKSKVRVNPTKQVTNPVRSTMMSR